MIIEAVDDPVLAGKRKRYDYTTTKSSDIFGSLKIPVRLSKGKGEALYFRHEGGEIRECLRHPRTGNANAYLCFPGVPAKLKITAEKRFYRLSRKEDGRVRRGCRLSSAIL